MKKTLKTTFKTLFCTGVLLSAMQIVESPNVSFASGTITVSNVPTVKRTSPGKGTELGTIFINIPMDELKNGDQVTFTLPAGAIFNTPFDTKVETDLEAPTSLNESYVVTGFDKGDLVAAATPLGKNMVTIKVIKVGIPTGDFKLAIKLGDIDISGISDGPVGVALDAPSDSSFPTTTQSVDKSNTQTKTSDGSSSNKLVKFRLGETNYKLNGQQKSLDVAPYLNKNGQVMLPVRLIANLVGISDDNIDWNSATQTITLNNGKNVVTFAVGQSHLTLNGLHIPMDDVAEIKAGRAMIPLRNLSKALGITILWDDSTQTITIP